MGLAFYCVILFLPPCEFVWVNKIRYNLASVSKPSSGKNSLKLIQFEPNSRRLSRQHWPAADQRVAGGQLLADEQDGRPTVGRSNGVEGRANMMGGRYGRRGGRRRRAESVAVASRAAACPVILVA